MDNYAVNNTYGIYHVIDVLPKDFYKVQCDECYKISVISGTRLFREINKCECESKLKLSLVGKVIKNFKILYLGVTFSEIECQRCKKTLVISAKSVLSENIKNCDCEKISLNAGMIGKTFGNLKILNTKP